VEAEELIAAIIADPDDQTAWMVYADWLLERGHPRGELIQLGPIAAAGDNAAKWRVGQLEADEDSLLSPALLARAQQWRFVFERGFIRLAEYQRHAKPGADTETIRALCSDPHVGLLHTLVLDIYEVRADDDPITGMNALVYPQTPIGDISGELSRLRRLRRLDVHGIACTGLSHPTLSELRTDSITCTDARIELPALEVLEWRAMSEGVGFGTMLRGQLPKLRSISIARGYGSMISELAGYPVAQRLESLNLQTNELAALPTLAEHAGAFPKLETLSVHGLHEDLEHAEVDRLRQALVLAYPAAKLYVRWADLLPEPPQEPEAPDDVPSVDEQSRRPDGTIDAIGRWNRGD
jgi:uncharacterized protein (TIGR02996 family)